MKRLRSIVACVLLVTAPAISRAQNGEILDRIIATVNRQPLLLSDWQASMRIEAFLQGREVHSFSKDEKKAALNRLIDRELLQQQMQADYSPSDKDVRDRVNSIRSQIKGAESDAGWSQILRAYGLSVSDVEDFVRTQLQVMRFVDLRLRPTIRIDEEAMQTYYRDTLVPEVRKKGAEPEPFQQVRPKIREILVQQRMEGVLESWLATLRSQSEVHITADPDSAILSLTPGGSTAATPESIGKR